MIDGARTRDSQNHNLELYQLSYDHRVGGRSVGKKPGRSRGDFRKIRRPKGVAVKNTNFPLKLNLETLSRRPLRDQLQATPAQSAFTCKRTKRSDHISPLGKCPKIQISKSPHPMILKNTTRLESGISREDKQLGSKRKTPPACSASKTSTCAGRKSTP